MAATATRAPIINVLKGRTEEQMEGYRNLAAAVAKLDPSDGEVPAWVAKEVAALDAEERRLTRAMVSATPGTDSAENGARFRITGLLRAEGVRTSTAKKEPRPRKGGTVTQAPLAAPVTGAVATSEAAPSAPPAYDGVPQPTQDCERVVQVYSKAHNIDKEEQDAILQRAIALASGNRRATHWHALAAVDALSEKNKIAKLDRTVLLTAQEKAAYAARQGGTPWEELHPRHRTGMRYWGITGPKGEPAA